MNAQEHYEEAERWLREVGDAPDETGATLALRTAQVHATLALAASLAPVSVTIQPPSRDGLVETFRRAQEVFVRRSS